MRRTLVALISGIMFALFAFQSGYAAEEGDISEDTAAEAALTAAAEAAAAAEKAAVAAAEAAAAAEKAAAAAAEAVEAAIKVVTAEVEVPAETAETSAAVETPPLLADIHQAGGLACSDCHAEDPPANTVATDTCMTCHEDYKELAASYLDPHNAHISYSNCSDCHHVHRESEKICQGCHHTFNVQAP